jgi:hypothetical protein
MPSSWRVAECNGRVGKTVSCSLWQVTTGSRSWSGLPPPTKSFGGSEGRPASFVRNFGGYFSLVVCRPSTWWPSVSTSVNKCKVRYYMRAGLLRSSRGRRRKDGMRAVWMPSVCLLPVPGHIVHQIGSTGQCSARSLGADGTPNEAGGKWGVCGPEAPGEVERGATAGQACSGVEIGRLGRCSASLPRRAGGVCDGLAVHNRGSRFGVCKMNWHISRTPGADWSDLAIGKCLCWFYTTASWTVITIDSTSWFSPSTFSSIGTSVHRPK